MGSQPNPSPKVLFGPFEFEHLSGDLRKFGNRIRLQGKPLQILSILLEQPGQVLSRDELQRHLWQGTTFVDFEQGLNTAVNKVLVAPVTAERMATIGAEPLVGPPQDVTAIVTRDREHWGKVIRDANIKPE